MIKILIESTSDTDEIAAEPTLLTIIVSTVPISEFNSCSKINGSKIRLKSALLNICFCSMILFPPFAFYILTVPSFFVNPFLFPGFTEVIDIRIYGYLIPSINKSQSDLSDRKFMRTYIIVGIIIFYSYMYRTAYNK